VAPFYVDMVYDTLIKFVGVFHKITTIFPQDILTFTLLLFILIFMILRYMLIIFQITYQNLTILN